MKMQENDLNLIAWYEKYKNSDDLKMLGSLVSKMKKRGWNLHSIYDGEDHYVFPSLHFAKMIASNLDDYSLRFQKERGTSWHGVWMINGQCPDTIADWNYSEGDPDRFNHDMCEVSDAIEAQYA
jgi:hypothetical protein